MGFTDRRRRGAFRGLTMKVTINDLMGERALATRSSGARFARSRPRMRGLGQDFFPMYSDVPTDYGVAVEPVTVPSSFYGFDNWAEPPIYATPAETVAASSSTDWGAAIQDVVKLIQAGQQAYAQSKIIELNMERARAGLQPLDPRNFSPSAAVNFGLTPQAQQMLLVGALALGAFLIFKGRGKRR